MTRITPLQWAVLKAYAAILPDGEARRVIVKALKEHEPSPSKQRVAECVAEGNGMLERGRITEFGRMAAKKYLPHLARRSA